jgi:hypothetical protein
VLLAWALLFLLGSFHFLFVARLERPGADSSAYIVLAEQLCRHGKYEFNFAPHVKYPPGFPLILAGWMLVSGQFQYEQLLRLIPVLGVAGLAVWFSVLRSSFAPCPAAFAVLLTAVSLPYFDMATRSLMADSPFLLMSGLCFLLLWRLGAPCRRPNRLQMMGVGALLLFSAVAVLIRNAGIAIGIGFLCWALLPPVRRAPHWRRARNLAILAGISCLLGLLAWVAWSRSHKDSFLTDWHMSGYTSEFLYKDPLQPDLGFATMTDYAKRMANNALVRAAQIASVAIPINWLSTVWYSPIVLFTLLLPMAGIWSSRHEPCKLLFGLYMLAYLALYALWPFVENARFVIPIAPVTFLFVLEGARWLKQYYLRHNKKITAMVVAIASLAFCTALRHPPTGKQEILALLFWAVAALSVTVVLLVPKASAVFEHLDGILAHWGKLPAAALAAVLVGWGLTGQVVAGNENLHPNPSGFRNENSRRAALWLRQAPPGNVMAGNVAVIHRLTGRFTAFFPPTADEQAILDAIRHHQVRFLVVCRLRAGEQPYFRPSEEQRLHRLQRLAPYLLRLVHESPDYFIFETDSSIWNASPPVYRP